MTRNEWIEKKNKEYEEKKKLLTKCRYSHTVLSRRYISKKIKGVIVPYKGMFGTGYKVYSPDPNSKYCIVEYYLYE